MGKLPQDVRLSPDGRTFYVADMGTDEVRLISARRTSARSAGSGRPAARTGSTRAGTADGSTSPTAAPARSACRSGPTGSWTPGRSPAAAARTWAGCPRTAGCCGSRAAYNGEVYAFNTATGRLIARIPVAGSPHGLCVWPQPGRYSLGHTGNMR